ncbi:MAG: hypothetical protein ATN35_10575 [Epulopiscium sp. Nele67-Bin004]|nr:MAG: hypothetical protein ATN35_10575 [Epulopiscium sp. Nele67-Bin004]
MIITDMLTQLSSTGGELGLDKIRELLHKMGNPQNNLKIIHVAGTNGKGSTCAMLANILRCEGYKVGLFTSPYIYHVNEEFNINGTHITDEKFISLLNDIAPLVNSMATKPSEFELRTALAFEYFSQENCDIVVLEVGLGGRLDSTNIIDSPILTVITKIGVDHVSFLGNDIEGIAFEKAGIIKNNCTCVVMKQPNNIVNIFENICSQKSAKLFLSEPNNIQVNSQTLDGLNISYKGNKFNVNLIGTYQTENIAVVLKAVEVLNNIGYAVSDSSVYDGLKTVKWSGRFEVISKEPLFIVDGAHNNDGIKAFTNTLDTLLPNQKCTFLIAVMSDKDYISIIQALIPYAKNFVAIAPTMPRALPADELATSISEIFKGNVYQSTNIADGVAKALQITENNPICCVGSLYVLGNVYRTF